jgi:hypothetical protein
MTPARCILRYLIGMYIIAVTPCRWWKAVKDAELVVKSYYGHFILLLIKTLFEINDMVLYRQ